MIKVMALANKQAEILIHEAIGENWYGDGLTSKKFVQQLNDLGEVDQINVRINSPGGAVSDGVAIYNALKSHGAKIVVSIEGLAASIASIIAMAGNEITMGQGALMMIHSPWTFAMGNSDDMRKTADVLDKFESALLDIYVARSGTDRNALADLLKAETWLDGAQAEELGLADKSLDGGDQEAAALLHTEHKASFRKFANEFRQPADVSPQRIAAALFPSATAESQEKTMNEEEKRAAEAAQKKAIQDAADAAVVAERKAQAERRSAIIALFTPFGDAHRELMDAALNDVTATAESTSKKLLAALGAGVEPLAANAIVIAGADARDKFKDGATNAILARLGKDKVAAGNEFAGRSLVDLAEHSLKLAGVRTIGLSKDGIARKVLSQSTSDFPALLSSTAGKVLRDAYAIAQVTWSTWCSIGQVSDFKIHPRIQLGSFDSLATIAENGEYTYGGLSESYENAQALTKGKGILFTRQMLVNDDLGGFNRRAMLMGNAAARSVNGDVYAALLSASGVGPTSTDGGAFFNATAPSVGGGGHANYTSTGTAMSVAALGVGRVAMRKQKDSGLKQPLNIVPAILLTSVAKEDTARTLITSETDPASSNSRVPNIYKNSVTVASDPLIDAAYPNSWYLFASPTGPAAAFEVVFLDGNQTPFIDEEVDFDTDAMKFKVRLDYGVALGDWRGAYRNLGA